MGETIAVLKTEYDQLIADQKLLCAMFAAGVDNWIGYEDVVVEDEED